MPILFDLPTDVAISILMDWLGDTKSLVALDSASARSIRWAYLGLVRDPAFALSEAFVFENIPNDLSDRIHWVNTRGVKIRAIIALASTLKDILTVHAQLLSTVHDLVLDSDVESKGISQSFRAVLDLLPSLTVLDMGAFHITEKDLAALAAMHHLRLRGLVLNEDSPHGGHVGSLINAFGSTLEVLNLGFARSVDTATLNLLTSKCSNVKHLSLACEDMSPDALVSIFGPRRLPLLEKIAVKMGPVVNDEVVLALSAAHPNLVSISADTNCSMGLSSVALFLSYCSQFREVDTNSFKFKTVFDAEDSRAEVEVPYYELKLRGPFAATANLRAVFEAMKRAPHYKHKVRSLQSSPPCSFSRDDFEEAMNAFGKDLHVFNLVLGDNISNLTVERLLRECTELRSIVLHECATMTDDTIIMLADHCHHVRFLSLTGVVNITAVSIHYLLQRMGQRLVCFAINDQCPQLDHETFLSSVVDFCVQLEMLDITDTGISAAALISHVIQPNRLPKLSQLIVEAETLESLTEFVLNEKNKANERWLGVMESGEDDEDLSDNEE